MSQLFSLFPNTSPWVVTLMSFLVVIVVLYLGRKGAHGLLLHFFRLLARTLRLGSKAVFQAEQRLQKRNREVLVMLGKEQIERELSRDFFRINKFVERDLGGYPKLQRMIQEQIVTINEDYAHSGEVPPPSPDWIKAVEALAKLPLNEKGNELTAKILSDIKKASEEQHEDAMDAYRKSTSERHAILKSMSPYWRRLTNSVDQVWDHLQELLNRSKSIDMHMERYEDIVSGSDKAESILKQSVITQFGISALVMLIAGFGAYFNFQLIAFPMAEMVDGATRLGVFKVSDIAALVLVFVEITMGIFLLEALHITKLFPIIGSMDDRMRVKGIWLFSLILLLLASMEAGLAYMRDDLAFQLRASDAALLGTDVAAGPNNVTLVVNMMMGFVLPLALIVVGIPLEYLLRSGRSVLGMLIEFSLRLLAITMRLASASSRQLGHITIHLYDILIMLPLWLESTAKYFIEQRGRDTVADNYSDRNNYSEEV